MLNKLLSSFLNRWKISVDGFNRIRSFFVLCLQFHEKFYSWFLMNFIHSGDEKSHWSWSTSAYRRSLSGMKIKQIQTLSVSLLLLTEQILNGLTGEEISTILLRQFVESNTRSAANFGCNWRGMSMRLWVYASYYPLISWTASCNNDYHYVLLWIRRLRLCSF